MTIGDSQSVRRHHPAQALRRWALLAFAVGAAFVSPRVAAGQTPIIYSWAGGGPPNGAVAESVSIESPNSVTRDDLGNYYVASAATHLVYRVDDTGLISVFAGGGTRRDNSANGHPGLEAALSSPSHLVWFGGGLYVVEPSRIRRIDTQTGLVSTVTGGGALPFTGGMRAIDAAACPSGLAISTAGDIYFTDICDQTIKRIVAGILTRVAGVPAADPGGLGGDGGPASQALFRRPSEVAVDPLSGDLAVLDQVYNSFEGAQRVRRISAGADHIVTGAANETIVTAYQMEGMTSVAFFLGQILWAQTYEGPAFLWVLFGGQLLQVGGVDSMTEPPAPDLGDGLEAAEARFGRITGMQALNQGEEILVADEALHAVRLISDEFNLVTRIAGNASASLSGDSGLATEAQLFRPRDIGFTGAGHAIFVDQDGGRLRRVDAITGEISTLLTSMPDGSALRLLAMAVHPLTGHVYFANRGQFGQSDERIHALDPVSRVVRVVAGTGRRTCSIDCEGGNPADDLGDYGPATNATFNTPASLAFDAVGNLYVADLANQRVRRIHATTGEVRTVAGTGAVGLSGDGQPATQAQLWDPWAVALSPDGTLYIADRNRRIRAVTPGAGGTIDTVVNGYEPKTMAVDRAGHLYFGAPWYGQVLVWDGSNVSAYVNASSFRGFSGDGGPAVDARMSTAGGLAVAGGALFVTDYTNHRIRVVRPGGGAPDLVLVKATSGTFRQNDSGSYQLTVTNNGTAPTMGAYTVTDVLPNGLVATDVWGDDWDCSASTLTTISCSSSVVLQPGRVAEDIYIDVDIGATVPASITNTASIAGGGDADPTNNTSSVTNPVIQTGPDLTIAKATASVFQQGGTATYDLVVSNDGSGPTTGAVTVSDLLPTGLTLAGLTSAAGWDCAASTAEAVSCISTTPLPAGQSASTVSFTVNIAADAAASLTNTATVSGGGDGDATNNSSSVTSAVTQLVPDLIITKTTPSVFEQQGTATYDLVVSNIGTGATRSAYTITDAMPAGLTLVGTPSGAGWDCAASTTTVVSCTHTAQVAPGQAAPMLTFTVNIAATAPVMITNTASVAGGGETDTTNNTSSVTRSVFQLVPDLTITKTTTSTFLQGGTATYEFVVRNSGNGSTFADYAITDVLPTGLTLAGTTPGAGWDCTASSSTVVSCTRSTALPSGQAAPAVTIAVDIAATAPTSVTNTASVGGGGEANLANNTASVTSAVTERVPDLTLTLDNDPMANVVSAGQWTNYSLIVRNVGSGPTTAATTVTATLSTGFLEGLPPSGIDWDCSASRAPYLSVTCTRTAPIPAGGAAAPIRVSGLVSPTGTDFVESAADVVGGGESNTTNNFASRRNGVVRPDLAISSIATTSTLRPLGSAVYTLAVANLGSGEAFPTGRVGVSFPFFSVTSVSTPAGGWACSPSSSSVSCDLSAPIAPGATAAPIVITVAVAANAPETVTVTAEIFPPATDLSATNNVASVTNAVMDRGNPDLALTKASLSSTFVPGGTVSYTLTVRNVGAAPTTAAYTVTDFLPSGLQLTQIPSGLGWTCGVVVNRVSCTNSTVIPGNYDGPVLTLQVRVPSGWRTPITNTASVVGGGEAFSSSNNYSSVTTPVGLPDLTLAIAATGTWVQGGQAIHSATVTNVGGASANEARVEMAIGILAAPYSVVPGNGWTCRGSVNITCTRTTPILPGESTLAAAVTANIPAWGVIVMAGGSVSTPSDANLSNNATFLRNTVAQSATDLTIEATASGVLQQRRTAVYTLTVSNQGTLAAPQDSFFVFGSNPIGLVFTAASGPGWNCTVSAAGFYCRPSASLGAFATAPLITATAAVARNAPASIISTFQVWTTGDSNPTNNRAIVTSGVAPSP